MSVKVDSDLGRLNLSLHDFFLARSIESLRPGGIAAFVISRYTMDKSDEVARRTIAGMADLLGAVRLPAQAMRAAAGTDVVVDLMFFQRRAHGVPRAGQDWLDLAPAACEGMATEVTVNKYFVDHPGQVLGRHAVVSGPRGPDYTCRPAALSDLWEDLAEALKVLPAGLYQTSENVPVPEVAEAAPVLPQIEIKPVAAGGTIREGSYLIGGDQALYQIVNRQAVKVEVRTGPKSPGIFQRSALVIRGLIPIRDAVRSILRAQESDESWDEPQRELERAYAAFRRKFGPINQAKVISGMDAMGRARESVRRPNLQPFVDDPDVWLVASVEDYDLVTDTATPGAIFTRRVVMPPPVVVIKNAFDAMAVSFNELGRVSIARCSELLHKPESEVLTELGKSVYLNPETGSWDTDDAYLSGLVRDKLSAARAAAEADPIAFQRNVTALEGVQPIDVPPSEITARLGAPWIPVDVVTLFATTIMSVPVIIAHTPELASWTVRLAKKPDAFSLNEWGIERRNAGELIEDALNQRTPQIFDSAISESGSEIRVLNAQLTEAAKEKLRKIKLTFTDWIWKDVERAKRLSKLYNLSYNNLVARRFDGAHLVLPGASNIITLRPHQKNSVWRGICYGNTYLAHVVGSGKTLTLIAAVVEQKRLGMLTKPMIVVPGHTLAQWAREFLLLYPQARILVADETNFERSKRQRFLARAATGDWDAIIITHSAFKFIAAPTEFEERLIKAQLADFELLKARVDENDRIGRKQIERLKEGLEAKLEALASRKDDLLTIAEMGVDQIVVDEAQMFRKLTFATNMTNLKGIDPDGSMRAWDLYVKKSFIEEKNPGRSLMMASGTPITNTMGEMFTLLRFMAEQNMIGRNLHQFDAWAAAFGDTKDDLELQPSGFYKVTTRFSQFVNIPELTDIFRSVADVIQQDDVRDVLNLPKIKGGKRRIMTAPPSAAFKAYQKLLGARITCILKRKGKVQKGDDILLSVITDGRHSALDTRLANPAAGLLHLNPVHVKPSSFDVPELWRCSHNDNSNKLNLMIRNAMHIYRATSDRIYMNPSTGLPYSRPGASQMIFCDLGTLNAERKRGFSAYRWIKEELMRLGVPETEIAFMQDYKKIESKLRLFNAVNQGMVRFLIGSTETMGTGVNAQQRLKALHHLDVPWIPSDVEQREGRIERQGNQNEEIELYAYATEGSMDAPMWQTVERKARFIAAVFRGDRSVRTIEDIGETAADQYALAKAMASGDQRLMQKAGLEAEISRLARLRAAHFDSQLDVRRRVEDFRIQIENSDRRIPRIEADIAQRIPTRGDAFAMTINDELFTKRPLAANALVDVLDRAVKRWGDGEGAKIGSIGGFELYVEVRVHELLDKQQRSASLTIQRNGTENHITIRDSATGILQSIEHKLESFESELAMLHSQRQYAKENLATYEDREEIAWPFEGELAGKRADLYTIDAELEIEGRSNKAA